MFTPRTHIPGVGDSLLILAFRSDDAESDAASTLGEAGGDAMVDMVVERNIGDRADLLPCVIT